MKKTVTAVIANYPHTLAIKSGELSSDVFEFSFTEYKGIPKAADDMLADLDNMAFDLCEMPLVTFFQAIDAGAKLKLLPLILGGEFHHGSCWYCPANGELKPEDLKGKKIGVRSYTQTTGLWVRGVLSEQYGVDPKSVTWVTTEPPHVKSYELPENVLVIPDADLAQMVRDGELAAVIQGTKQGAPEGLVQIIPDIPDAIARWYDKNKCVPVNHLVSYQEKNDEDVVKAACALFCKGIDETYPVAEREEPFVFEYGVDGAWKAIEVGMNYSFEQGLISRTFSKEEVFGKIFV